MNKIYLLANKLLIETKYTLITILHCFSLLERKRILQVHDKAHEIFLPCPRWSSQEWVHPLHTHTHTHTHQIMVPHTIGV